MTTKQILGLTWNEAEQAVTAGRITNREWRRFVFAWSWSSGRFSALADRSIPTPDRYFRKFGQSRYFMRRGQVAAICARLAGNPGVLS